MTSEILHRRMYTLSRHLQLVISVCTAQKPVCAISLGAHDLELPFANKHATSLPGDGETEYSMVGAIITTMYMK